MALTREEIEQIAKEVASRVSRTDLCFDTGASLFESVTEALKITGAGNTPTPDLIALIIQGMGEAHGCGRELEGVDVTGIMKAYITRDMGQLNKSLDALREIIHFP